jgi:uncharacterized membrane protein YdjX (TVP38/TMEM64 family)
MGRSPALRRIGTLATSPAAIVAVVLAAAFGIAVLVDPATWGGFVAMASGDRETLRQTVAGFGVMAPAVSILLNVFQAVVSPIPGFVIPYVDGAVFGVWLGTLVTWVGGLVAASTCFWIARTFGGGFAERMCGRSRVVEAANRRVERHGLAAVVGVRLVPGLPFDLLSYLAGLTRMRFWPFLLGTAVGSAPHAFLFAFMGSTLNVPLWLGLLMTPLVGLAISAAVGLRRLLARRRPVAGAPVPEAPVPAMAAVTGAIRRWTLATPRMRSRRDQTRPTARCGERGLVPVGAWRAAPALARDRSI